MLTLPILIILALSFNSATSIPVSQDLRLQSTEGFEALISTSLPSSLSLRRVKRARRQAQDCSIIPSMNGTIRVLVASNHSVLGLISTNEAHQYHGLVPTDHTSPLFVQIPSKDVFALTTIPFHLAGLSRLLVREGETVECRGSLEATILVQNRLKRRRALRMDNGRGVGGKREGERRGKMEWTMECVEGIYLLDPVLRDSTRRSSSLYYDTKHNSFSQTLAEPSPSLDVGPVAEVLFQFVPY